MSDFWTATIKAWRLRRTCNLVCLGRWSKNLKGSWGPEKLWKTVYESAISSWCRVFLAFSLSQSKDSFWLFSYTLICIKKVIVFKNSNSVSFWILLGVVWCLVLPDSSPLNFLKGGGMLATGGRWHNEKSNFCKSHPKEYQPCRTWTW